LLWIVLERDRRVVSIEAMRKVAFAPVALIISVAILLPGCGRKATSTEHARHYDTRGFVQGFSPDRQTIEIQHEDVPGFMPSMTMSFSVRNRNEIADLKIGEAISFRMTVTDKELLVDQVKAISAKEVRVARQTAAPIPTSSDGKRLREGDTIPSFSVINQEGKPMTLEKFRGQPFVLTFIFTRCPIAKFCPLMSNNFAELQQAIKNGGGKLARTRLLSITLDPAFDTPEILKQYSANLKADPAIWTFATGEPKEVDPLIEAFSVYRQTEGGTISHGLATALISSEGTIKKIWRGNGWLPSEVTTQIEQL
jgi:protein SCO1/2